MSILEARGGKELYLVATPQCREMGLTRTSCRTTVAFSECDNVIEYSSSTTERRLVQASQGRENDDAVLPV